MKSLSPIIKSLKNSEIRFIRKIYSAQPNGEDQKRLKLFEYVLAGKSEITDSDAAEALYSQQPNSAYSHVKNRLKNDLLNFLMIQDLSKRRDISKRYQIELSCTKRIMQAELLLARGLYEEGEKLLQKSYKIAVEHELFSEIIKIKHLLRTTVVFRKGINEFNKYNKDMNYYLQEHKKWLQVNEYYCKITLPNQFNTNNKREIIELSEKFSAELDQFYAEEDSSARFNFQYYLFKVSVSNIRHNFDEALKYAIRLVDIVEGKTLLSTNTNRSGAYLVLAKAYIDVFQFESAIRTATIAEQNFRKGMINHLRALELLFFAHLRNKDYTRARELVQEAFLHKITKTNNLLKARWQYFEANLLYILKEKDKAFKLLRKNNDLLKDKSGWLIGFKILEMILSIDEKDWYWLGYQLNNFNQLLSRQQTKANIHRAKIIGQIIRSLLTNGGDFDITLDKSASKVMLLQNGKGDYHWDPMGYEIIRFDEWIKGKAKKRNSSIE